MVLLELYIQVKHKYTSIVYYTDLYREVLDYASTAR